MTQLINPNPSLLETVGIHGPLAGFRFIEPVLNQLRANDQKLADLSNAMAEAYKKLQNRIEVLEDTIEDMKCPAREEVEDEHDPVSAANFASIGFGTPEPKKENQNDDQEENSDKPEAVGS